MTDPTSPLNGRALLADLFQAAVTAAAPGPALGLALASRTRELKRRVHVLALGKAAYPMAVAAVAWLKQRGQEPGGGIIIAPEAAQPPYPGLPVLAGDHPEPGPRSLAAAEALQDAVSRVRPEDEVWVLLSGGTTSLIGAPTSGIRPEELATLYRLLLGSGLDIAAMNRIRKRFARWGAGRLAAALAPACVKNFTISDVIGDDLAAIGSGPCVPDQSTAAEVHALLTSAGLWEKIPDTLRRTLVSVERGEAPETPKPGDPAFRNLEVHLVASNRLALDAIVRRAGSLGMSARLINTELAGEAAPAGRQAARTLLSYSNSPNPQSGGVHKNTVCLVWGGETTVTLGSTPPGKGGRNQEFALAAAEELDRGGQEPRNRATVCLLAAGTDGRDGPTDAAGAIVDASTWQQIRRAGRDPARDLAGHNAYPALDAAGALLKIGMTGTNVMDVVIGLVLGG